MAQYCSRHPVTIALRRFIQGRDPIRKIRRIQTSVQRQETGSCHLICRGLYAHKRYSWDFHRIKSRYPIL